jgi:hypothetical protein
MKLFEQGDTVYVVRKGYLVEEEAQLGGAEPLAVVFGRVEDGLAYVKDRAGLTWEIPMAAICGVPEGHVFAANQGSTGKSNPCLVCGCEIIVPYRGPKGEGGDDA